MKFSVLLPTRNRLELLKYAVESVRRQDYDDWEIIVSDNDSEDDIAGYLGALDDSRIRYFRTGSFVSVTENWNIALEQSCGDYLVMLGDDDCLMKGYFRDMARAIADYDRPDFIYTKAFMYAYPGVVAEHPEGYLRTAACAGFFGSAREPFLLGKAQARDLVRQSMDFKLSFDFNMQFSLVSRKFVDSLRYAGRFYQSPYPDYYAHNVMFLKAERILIYPRPMVTVGISAKSFGFYYHNNLEKQGGEFLNNLPDPASVRKLEKVLLPGTDINTCWLFAMEAIRVNFATETELSPNYLRYRFLQVLHVFRGYYFAKRLSRPELKLFCRQMRLWEKLCYAVPLHLSFTLLSLIPYRVKQSIAGFCLKLLGQYPATDSRASAESYRNILEVFERVECSEEFAAASGNAALGDHV